MIYVNTIKEDHTSRWHIKNQQLKQPQKVHVYKIQYYETRPEHGEQHSLHASEKASIGAGVESHCTNT